MSNESNQSKLSYSNVLLGQHVEFLTQSAISPEVAQARGYRSLNSRKEIQDLGFQPRQGNVPALAIPIRDVHGKEAYSLIRPDTPRVKNNRKIRYEQPQGTVLKLDVPTSTLAALADPSKTLWIVDGPRQADALVSSGRAAIAVLGYQAWRHFRRTSQGRPVLSDWDAIDLNGREVIIAFGSNVLDSATGQSEIHEFTKFLRGRGATVKHVIPEAGPDGRRVAVDDLLANNVDIEALITEPPLASALVPVVDDAPLAHPYRKMPKGFFIDVVVGDEVDVRQLTNWTARIVADVLLDDGLEQRRLFEIEASLNGRSRRFYLTPSEFEEMDWPLAKLGPKAIIVPGYGIKDHVRAAIQLFSDEISRRKEFAHTGWTRLPGGWGYLHAGGIIRAATDGNRDAAATDRPTPNTVCPNNLSAVGPLGPFSDDSIDTIYAQLPHELSGFCLPEPPRADDVANRVHCALAFLDAAEDRISFPLLALVVRAVIAAVNFSLHLVGRTGVLKTALATVAQQFFGAGLDGDHLVGHWQGTANSLESLAFHLKDMMLLIDDFSPTGARGDIQKSHREAERLLRAKGNSGGRSRCRPDGTFRAARSPRAALLLTGEDIPEGHSLRARLLTIEVKEGDIKSDRLKYCQEQLASTGILAEFLAAFIQWLAPQYDQVLEELQCSREGWKDDPIPNTVHRRTYQAVRELEFGFDMLRRFALECNAINENWSNELCERCWNALEAVAWSQEQHHRFANPVDQFQILLGALFASKKVNVADYNTYKAPTNDPGAWGYRPKSIPLTSTAPTENTNSPNPEPADGDESDFSRLLGENNGHQEDGDAEDDSNDKFRTIWVPCGTKIGWVSNGYLYLIPEIVFTEVQALASRLGSPIPLTLPMLERRLADAGIVERDHKRNRIRHRISVEGRRQPVLLMPIQWHYIHPGWGFPNEDHEEDQDIDELLA